MDSQTELRYLKEDIDNYLKFLEEQIIRLDFNEEKNERDKYSFHLNLAKKYLKKNV